MEELEYRDDLPKRERPREMPWSPKLLSLVRREVLRESVRDFVLRENVAQDLQALPSEVGGCLARLVKEGLLLPLCPIAEVDRDGDPVTVRYRGTTLEWHEGAWKAYLSWSGTRSRKTGRMRTNAKRSGSEVDWDGRGYYILRDTEAFRRACRSEGLPEDPVTDAWTCRSCGASNDYRDRKTCRKCYASRFKAPDPPKKKEAPPCPRCGSALEFKRANGKKRVDHPLRKCNLALVRDVLEA